MSDLAKSILDSHRVRAELMSPQSRLEFINSEKLCKGVGVLLESATATVQERTSKPITSPLPETPATSATGAWVAIPVLRVALYTTLSPDQYTTQRTIIENKQVPGVFAAIRNTVFPGAYHMQPASVHLTCTIPNRTERFTALALATRQWRTREPAASRKNELQIISIAPRGLPLDVLPDNEQVALIVALTLLRDQFAPYMVDAFPPVTRSSSDFKIFP